jgi:hypothetical protein
MPYNWGMSYENATATKLLATHCICCNRPLLDATSVERGIGPDCFKKFMGCKIQPNEANRHEANEIVYHLALAISASQDREDELRYVGAVAVAGALDRLRALGYDKLAAKLEDVWVTIRITEEDGRLVVVAPYHEDAVKAMRAIPGRRWVPARKVNTFPPYARAYLWRVLQRFYAGQAGIGPKGPFVVTQEQNAA